MKQGNMSINEALGIPPALWEHGKQLAFDRYIRLAYGEGGSGEKVKAELQRVLRDLIAELKMRELQAGKYAFLVVDDFCFFDFCCYAFLKSDMNEFGVRVERGFITAHEWLLARLDHTRFLTQRELGLAGNLEPLPKQNQNGNRT